MRASGVATIMFTDLEASTDTTTPFAERRGGRRAVPPAATGSCASSSPPTAVATPAPPATAPTSCSSTRRAAPWPAPWPSSSISRPTRRGIAVRIGLNAGEVQEGEDGALFGAAINLASRVMDRAGGGEILVTDTVRHLVGTMPDARFRERRAAAGRVGGASASAQHLYAVQPAAGPVTPRTPDGRARASACAPSVAAVLATIIIAAAVVLVATRGAEAVDVRPNSVAILDPEKDGGVVEQVPVGRRPTGIVLKAQATVWVAERRRRRR